MPLRRWMVLLAVALPSCAPDAVTTEGERIEGLYQLFFALAVVVFVVVAGLIGWSIIRYRKRPGDEELPEQFHSNVWVEVVWFAVPTVLVVVLFVFSTGVLWDIDDEGSDGSLRITVEGFQWGWVFRYEDSDIEVVGTPQEPARIALPTDREIEFLLLADDVIHSFYVPKFLFKRDMIPGQPNEVVLTIEEEGEYRGACAEFCGLLHDRMDFTIEAVDDGDFDQWLQEAGEADGNG